MGSTGGVAAAKMAAVPVKAPREALTGKAAFQAAGSRRRGARRSERGGYWRGERGKPVASGRAKTQESHKVPRMGQYVSHAWSYLCPTRGTGMVPRVGPVKSLR